MNKFEELEKLQYLKQNNAITDKEFENEKQKILNDTSAETINTNIPNKKAKQKIKPWEIVLIPLIPIQVKHIKLNQ